MGRGKANATILNMHKPCPKPKTIKASDLLAKEFAELRYAVPGIVPEGVSLLAGKPKLGKSWLGLGWCVATAAGGYALGKIKVEVGDALYMGLEDNERRLQSRLKKMLGGSETPDGLEVATAWPRLSEGGTEALREWLAAHTEARLVVIDTLAKIRPEIKGQNVYAEDYAALEKLLPLAAEYGVAIVVVTHTRKLAAIDPLDEISGSTGLSGGVDGALVLKRERGRADAFLHVTGRDVEEDTELALSWDQNTAAWILAGDAQDFRMNAQRAKILDALRASAPTSLAAKEVSEAIGEDYNATRQRLYQMHNIGEIKKVDRGKYTIPNNPNNAHFEDSLLGNPEFVRTVGHSPNNAKADTYEQNGTTVRAVRNAIGDDLIEEYDQVVSENRAAGALEVCKHEVLGGCWLCNKPTDGGGTE